MFTSHKNENLRYHISKSWPQTSKSELELSEDISDFYAKDKNYIQKVNLLFIFCNWIWCDPVNVGFVSKAIQIRKKCNRLNGILKYVTILKLENLTSIVISTGFRVGEETYTKWSNVHCLTVISGFYMQFRTIFLIFKEIIVRLMQERFGNKIERKSERTLVVNA